MNFTGPLVGKKDKLQKSETFSSMSVRGHLGSLSLMMAENLEYIGLQLVVCPSFVAGLSVTSVKLSEPTFTQGTIVGDRQYGLPSHISLMSSNSPKWDRFSCNILLISCMLALTFSFFSTLGQCGFFYKGNNSAFISEPCVLCLLQNILASDFF